MDIILLEKYNKFGKNWRWYLSKMAMGETILLRFNKALRSVKEKT